jgi:hypothetical protein
VRGIGSLGRVFQESAAKYQSPETTASRADEIPGSYEQPHHRKIP